MRTVTDDNLSRPLDNYVQKNSIHLVNNIANISTSKGKGFIKKFFIEEGFCVQYNHFYLYNDCTLKWVNDAGFDSPLFKLIFTPSFPNDTKATDRVIVKSVSSIENPTILNFITDHEQTEFVQQNKWINYVALIFTKKWLEYNFKEALDKIFKVANTLKEENKFTPISKLINLNHYAYADELIREMHKNVFVMMKIKTNSFNLLNSFLDNLVNHYPQTMPYSRIIEVEKRLREYYNKQMPLISQLAREYNMSEATLKRHFKAVYGKSIYAYYLEKKLAIGKNLIISDNKSISEIAFILGYNKTNSFSKAFKKHYGILPKDVKSFY